MAFEGGEGFRADMMLDAFSIHFSDAFRDTEAEEERDDGFMPALARSGEGPAFFGQKNRAIWLGGDKTGLLQASNGAIDGDVGDAEPLGKVNDASFAEFHKQIGDCFDVILGDFIRVFAPGLSEILCLSFTDGARIFRCLRQCHSKAMDSNWRIDWQNSERAATAPANLKIKIQFDKLQHKL